MSQYILVDVAQAGEEKGRDATVGAESVRTESAASRCHWRDSAFVVESTILLTKRRFKSPVPDLGGEWLHVEEN